MRLKRLAALSVSLSFFALTAWALEPVRRAPPPWCLPTQDPEADFLLTQVRFVATSAESSAVELRDTLAAMPVVDTSEVELLTDELLCQRASAALDSFYYETPRTTAVYLARAGTRYAIHPPIGNSDLFRIIHVDSAFGRIGVVVH